MLGGTRWLAVWYKYRSPSLSCWGSPGIALGRIPCISDVKTGNNPKFHCGSLSCQKSPNDTAGGLAGCTRCREFTAASHLCARVASARRAKALQHPDHVLHEVQGAARVSVAAQDSEGWSAVPFCRFLGKKPSLADCYCAKPRERPWIARSCLNMPRSLMHFECIFLKTVRNRQRNRLVVFLGFACDHTGRSSWRASNYWASLRWTRYNPLDMYRQQGSPNCENLPQSSLFAHSCLSLSCTLATWSLVMLRCT